MRAQYVLLPFYKDGTPLADCGASPRWGMTLRAAGSMRFRWNEQNLRRDAVLAAICSGTASDGGVAGGEYMGATVAASVVKGSAAPVAANAARTPVPLELIHSKTVYDVRAAGDTLGKTGDGMITTNRALVPVVTVADCMPLFLYDARTGVFGSFHSGWKGTGIIAEGIALAEARYGARREELCVAIGAHIQHCCYVVDAERAAYFAREFGEACVSALSEYNAAGSRLYALSLLEANLAALRRAGIRDCNIVAATDCTCCTRLPLGVERTQGAAAESAMLRGASVRIMPPAATAAGTCAQQPAPPTSAYYPFGSFRRQAAFMVPSLAADAKSRLMTVQAAFCGWL